MKKSGMVALAGRPNSGKSTLMNKILGTALSIVTPKAQTTRERVRGVYTDRVGQMVFTDTPGIHRAKIGGFNEFMVKEAKEAIHHDSDLIWYLVDPASGLSYESPVIEILSQMKKPVIVLFNKIDTMDYKKNREQQQEFQQSLLMALEGQEVKVVSSFEISAKHGSQVEKLMTETWRHLKEGPFLYPEDELSDRPVRFFVGEKIREQLYLHLGQEIPYSCAVSIEKMKENQNPVLIEAHIHVERESQKGMVVGKGGSKIRMIGSDSRKQLEKFLERRVYLDLKVKVLPQWTKNKKALREMGYVL